MGGFVMDVNDTALARTAPIYRSVIVDAANTIFFFGYLLLYTTIHLNKLLFFLQY